MSPLLSVLRAAHCQSTHHYFALDALRLVQTDAGIRMRGLLLKYHERYLTGAKDPDTRFRDFQNHVIHVQDGYFGGAPRLAIHWYERLISHLVSSRWEDAAYATGVLSHYFTDPLMPLHTSQCERETLVHRPMERSVCKSYDRILKRWTEDELRLVFQLGDGDGWLGEAILKGAKFSNRSYRKLVGDYNLDRGVEDPVAGLNEEAIQIFAELFGLAITGLARVIERAADEAKNCGVTLPSFGLKIPALLATLQVPEQLWLRRITDNQERKEIDSLVGEYRETGKIQKHLPAELYIKQRVLEVRQREAAWAARRRDAAVALGAQTASIVALPVEMDPQSTPATATLESIAATTQSATPETQPTEASITIASDDQPITLPFPSQVKRVAAVRRAA